MKSAFVSPASFLRAAPGAAGGSQAPLRATFWRAASGLQVIWSEVAAIVALLLVCRAGAGAAGYLVLAMWALGGYRRALQALSLSFLITYLNSVLFPAVEGGNALRWVVFGAATASIFFESWRRHAPLSPAGRYLLLFGFVAAFLNFMVSPSMIISLFKIASFIVGVSAILLASRLARQDPIYWQSWFFTLLLTVLVLSVPTLAVASIGRAKSGLGFQGILDHPQSFGSFICMPLAWLTASALLREHRFSLMTLTVLLGWAFVVLSQARTSLLAVILGLVFTLAVMAGSCPRALSQTLRQMFRDRRTTIGLLVLCTGLLVTLILRWSSVQQSFTDYLSKGREDKTLSEGFQRSRGALIELSIENFKKSPLMGIGFGMPSEPPAVAQSSDFVFSAPVEKGFLPSATLEENGVIGTLVLLFFLASLTRAVVSGGYLPAIWMFFTCLSLNLGEMIFFSVGGLGYYLWLLIGLSLCLKRPSAPPLRTAKR